MTQQEAGSEVAMAMGFFSCQAVGVSAQVRSLGRLEGVRNAQP